MRKILIVAAVAEAATGLALLVLPGAVCWLIFGSASDEAGRTVARLTGVALLALGLSCWPGEQSRWPRLGMLGYNALASVLLLVIGSAGQTVGLLLWPAAIAHVALTILLAIALAITLPGP
jgi:hypothetical protein